MLIQEGSKLPQVNIRRSNARDSGNFYIGKEQPIDWAESLASQYNAARPFPHIVIDNFLPEDFAKDFLVHFPSKEDCTVFRQHDNANLKRGYRPSDMADNPCAAMLYLFNTGVFVNLLESITGISGLIPDPFFEGGGLHEIESGGHLGIHADFNLHPKLNLVRRINVLIYLNEDWPKDFGGNLELWNMDMNERCEVIAPLFNRCVIFNTDKKSFHGHPEPLSCPVDRCRRSIALYYYTSPVDQLESRDDLNTRTDFQTTPP